VPDSIKILVGEDEEFNFKLPMEGSVTYGDVDVLSVNNKTVPGDQIKLNLSQPFTIKSSTTGSYKINLKLFGFLNFKEVTIGVIDQK
jgi:stage IV sporulation protein B